MAKKKKQSPFTGGWRIVSMGEYDDDFLDEEVEAYIEFDDRGWGDFHFGNVQGQMDCRQTMRDGEPAVEWSWDSNAEMDAAQGRGWAVLKGDELHGMIFFHGGDDSEFVAERAKAPKRPKRKASKTEVVIWHKDGFGGMWPCDEPGIAQLKDKRLLMRTTLGRIYATTSKDGGRNWHMPQPTDLATSYSPCRLRRIPTTGDLLCIWNQMSADEIRRGYRRGRLSLASTDDGKNFLIEPTREIAAMRFLRKTGESRRNHMPVHLSQSSGLR